MNVSPPRNASFSTSHSGLGMHKVASTESLTSKISGQSLEDIPRAHRVAEILFHAAAGDLTRFKSAVDQWEESYSLQSSKLLDYDSRTPLHVAAHSGSFAVAQYLVEQKVKINAVDRFGLTPLMCATRSGHKELVKLIQDNGGLICDRFGDLSPLKDYSAQFSAELESSSDMWEIAPDAIDMAQARKLGEGQFGIVSLARWRGTEVVVKTLKADLSDPTHLRELKTEIGLQHKLHHPNVVQFFGVVIAAQPVRIVTEYMAAGSLDDAFKDPVSWPLRKATSVCRDIACGLWYLHELQPNPVIHRDLKPANVLMRPSGVCKVADFGMSKTVQNMHEDTAKFTMTGETGSYRYMAPEVYRHEPYGSAVDVYSWAMIAYQAFLWMKPFEDKGGVEACQAACTLLRPVTTGIPKEIETLLKRAWAPDPDARGTCGDITLALDKYKDSLPPEKPPASQCCTIA